LEFIEVPDCFAFCPSDYSLLEVAGIDNKECIATLALSDALTKRLDFIHFLLYIKAIREIVKFIALGVESTINANRSRRGFG
jgi:hypothetical protein